MKRLISLVFLASIVLLLAACNNTNGKYYAYDDTYGKLELKIDGKKAAIRYDTLAKAIKKSSSEDKPDISKTLMQGTVDEKAKTMTFTQDGEKHKMNYTLKDQTFKLTDEDKVALNFYKEGSTKYKKSEKSFDEDSILNQVE